LAVLDGFQSLRFKNISANSWNARWPDDTPWQQRGKHTPSLG
jgi:hypothetical protein